MKLHDLFKRCLNAAYVPVEEAGDYACELEGDTLYVFFQWSDEKLDWVNNFYFIPKRRCGVGIRWFCHRGYARVWEAIKPSVREEIEFHIKKVKKVIVVGYSHGAAVAAVAYDWLWYNFPHLRDSIEGYGFGAPRVYFGLMNADMKARFRNFHPVRCRRDIVTHCPFVLFGFRHVNKIVRVGRDKNYGPIRSHYPQSYLVALKEYDAMYGAAPSAAEKVSAAAKPLPRSAPAGIK